MHAPLEGHTPLRQPTYKIAAWAALAIALLLLGLSLFGGAALSVHGPLFLLAMPGVIVVNGLLERAQGITFEAIFFVGNFLAWYLICAVIIALVRSLAGAFSRDAT